MRATWSSISPTVSSELQVRRSARAKAIRLRVDPRTGAVLLTVPQRVAIKQALAWAAEQQGWIDRQRAAVPPVSEIEPGGTVPLYGIPHRIDWDANRPRMIRVEENRIVIGGPRDTLESRLLRWLRREALAVLTQDTQHYAAKAGVTVAKVGVGDTLSRWGSCSSSGAIRYSWRLILAPPEVRRATAAHEVAHRVHMNHSPAFHGLVAELFGADPKPQRDWLRREGAGLHRLGRRL
jgi:predicted metal-dependent hydrolase